MRTRAQRRYRRQGYTFEIAYLRNPFRGRSKAPGLIIICKPSTSWREYRKHLLPGEVIRPIAKHYIHKGRKP